MVGMSSCCCDGGCKSLASFRVALPSGSAAGWCGGCARISQVGRQLKCVECTCLIELLFGGLLRWKYARAWVLARASGEPPFAVFGRPDLARVEWCPLCWLSASLQHYDSDCASNLLASEQGLEPCTWPEILQATADLAVLEMRIRWLGLRCALIVQLA